jgi:hypothetical protein
MGEEHMKLRILIAALPTLCLVSSPAKAHWCDDLWASSYNIVVRPETDTATSGAMNIYVQNNMGYQLINFKLGASVGGTAITVTAPATLKVAGTLLPGEKGTWKLSGGKLGKIEDVVFSVSFGEPGQSGGYPTSGAKAVMVVKTDGSLYPAPPGIPGLASSGGDQARSLQYSAVTDFEDVEAGLDKLMTLYCAGRASFGSTDGVSQTYCKTTTSIDACPTAKPGSGSGSKYDYMHLWAAGELAARRSALGAARTAALRARLQCGVNDGDVGFAGYALLMLGYLGEDPAARTFIQSKVSASGDLGSIAKAALLLMGNPADLTTYKAEVQAGLKSGSVFVAAACAVALGIAAADDTAVAGTLIPLVKWIEPDTSDDGKAMYAAHLLELVAWHRRGWAAKGADKGAVTFYGDAPTPTGGDSGGSGGAVGTGGEGGAGATPGAGGTGEDPGTGGSTSGDGKGGGCSIGGPNGTGLALCLLVLAAIAWAAARRHRSPS